MGWSKIIADPKFAAELPETKQRVADNYFRERIASDPGYQAEKPEVQEKVRRNFMGSIPDLKRSKSVEIAASTLRGFIDIPKGLLSLPSVAYDFPKALAQQAPQILADQATGKSRSKSPWLTDFSQVAGQEPQQLGPPKLTLPDNGFMQDYENRKPDPGKQLSRAPEIIGRPQKSPALRPSDNLNPLSWQGAAAIGPQILSSMTGAYALSKLGQFGNALGRSKTVFSPVRPGPAAAPGAARVIDRTVETAETAAEAARARQAFAGIMGSVDAGSQYTDRVAFYKSQGLSDEAARQRASLEVAAYLPMSIALEGAGAQGFMGSQPGGLTRRFVAGAIPEAAQEGAQGLAQGLTNYTVSGDQGDLNAIPGDMAVGMVYGAGAGGAMGAIFGQRPRATQEPSPAPVLTPAPETGKPDVKKIETPVAQEAANADIGSSKRSEVKPAQRKRLDGKIQVLQESRVSQALRDGGEAGGNIRLDLDGADARDAEWRFAETVGETFGKEVVPFAQDGGEPFNGATDPKVKHTIFINTRNYNPAQFVVGHELLEAIEDELGRDHTAVEAFKQAVAGAINDPEAYRVYLSESSGTEYTAEGAMREHRADFLGQSIARPEFWQRLADTAPDVFRRTAETFLRLIEKIKATVIGKEYDAERWMAESGLEDARRAAARLLVEYRRSGGSRAIPGQVQPLNTGPAGPGRTAKTYGGQSGTDYVYVHPNDTVEHPIKYRLIEADGLKQSNDPQTFAVNKDYPRSLQPRAYESQPDMFGTKLQRTRFDPERVAEMNARAQAEEEGKRTIGRPELANPAGPDERSRRFVDAVDEIRKEDGIPQPQRDDDVEQAAKELLDRDYEGTKATLLSRANEGAGLTAVETRAAQEIVRRETFEALKKGDTKALADTAGLAEAWRETGTEQARAFRQRRDMFKSPEERAAAYLAEAIVRPDKATQRRLDGAKAESKKDILKQWAEKVKTLKAKLEALGIDTSDLEATAKNPDKGAAAIRAISESRADAWDKLYEYWICSILSAPTTQGANIIGNTASMGWDMTGQRLAEALVNVFVQDKRSARFGELPYIAAGFIPGIARASRNALKAFKHERPVFEEEVMGSGPWTGTVKHELKGPAISGLKGRIIRTPLRALTAMDEFAKSLIGQMQAGAEAYRIAKDEGLEGEALSARIRELVSDLGSDAWQSSIKYAKQLTFQEELGSLGKAVMKARADLPVLGLALPFVKTPANIFKMGIRKSPLGSIGMLARIANQGAISLNWNKSGRWEYSKNLFVRDAAEQLWAWGLTWLMAGLLGDDDDRGPLITGTKPIKETSPGERAAAWRTAPPMSVRIGDRYYSYARIEPLATTLALTIDLMTDASEAETGEDWLLALGKVHSHIAAQVREKTFMQAIGDILDAIESPDSAGKWAANFGSSWMPNIIRHSGRSADPFIRETRSWGEGLDRARMLGVRTSQKAFPFGENRGMPKVTPWGEEIKSSSVGSPTSDFFFRLLPTKLVDPGDRDPRALNLDRLLTNWNNQHSDDQWWVDVPDPYFTYRDDSTLKTDKVWMNDQQYNEFLKEGGKGALDKLSRMKLNVENPTIRDIRLMQRIIDQERQIARRKLFGRAAYEKEKEAFMGSK